MSCITSVYVRKERSNFLTRYVVNTQLRYCYKRTIKQCPVISHYSKGCQPCPLVVCTIHHYPCCPAWAASQPPARCQLAVAHCTTMSKEGEKALDHCSALKVPNILVGRKDREALSCTCYLKAPQEAAQLHTSPPQSL